MPADEKKKTIEYTRYYTFIQALQYTSSQNMHFKVPFFRQTGSPHFADLGSLNGIK
jgi:hypothetical protein